jgi:hypothetical protein
MANSYWKKLTMKSKWKTIWRDIRAHKGERPVGVTTSDQLYQLAVTVYHTREARPFTVNTSQAFLAFQR